LYRKQDAHDRTRHPDAGIPLPLKAVQSRPDRAFPYALLQRLCLRGVLPVRAPAEAGLMGVQFPNRGPYDKLALEFLHRSSRSGLAMPSGDLTSQISRLTSG